MLSRLHIFAKPTSDMPSCFDSFTIGSDQTNLYNSSRVKTIDFGIDNNHTSRGYLSSENTRFQTEIMIKKRQYMHVTAP